MTDDDDDDDDGWKIKCTDIYTSCYHETIGEFPQSLCLYKLIKKTNLIMNKVLNSILVVFALL